MRHRPNVYESKNLSEQEVKTPEKSESKDFLDLTYLKTYTIDSKGAHEIDDALSYEFKFSLKLKL